MAKLRVGVLMGGKSIEREVSFNSGRTVCDHLDTNRYDIVPLFQKADGTLYLLPWRFLHRGKTTDFEHRLTNQEKITWDALKNHVDFIYNALHGRYGEDGALQGFLEVLQIPYLGSKVLASALGMDKFLQKDFLRQHGINVPKEVRIHAEEITKGSLEIIVKHLARATITFPCVVKPRHEGSSLGVSIVSDANQLLSALQKASTIDSNTVQDVLIEELLEGMEFSCIIIEDYTTKQLLALPPTEIVKEHDSSFFDYDQKYMPGRALKYTPARCSAEATAAIQETCCTIMKILDIKTIGRIDGFLTADNRIYIIDPNTLAGMAPSSFVFCQAAHIGMNHTQVINHLIKTELAHYSMIDTIKNDIMHDTVHETKKIRVAILLGGRSNEKEISLESGRNVVYKLSPQKYEALPLFINSNMHLYYLTPQQLVLNSTKEIEKALRDEQKIAWNSLSEHADFAFIALHGGEGENGSVQGALEMLDIPYNGSGIATSALCMDKYKTNQLLHAQEFEVPHSLLIAHEQWITEQEAVLKGIKGTFSLPFIIKPFDDGCSVFVSKINTHEEIKEAIKTFFKSGKTHILVEEYITGMELTVGVIGNEKPIALAPSQAVATQGILSIEEKFLPGAGENQTPAPLAKQQLEYVQEVISNVYKAVDCKGYARIDCFYQSAMQSPTKQERVVILEINTLPALTPATCLFHQAAEATIKPMDFIDQIITLGFEVHRKINC